MRPEQVDKLRLDVVQSLSSIGVEVLRVSGGHVENDMWFEVEVKSKHNERVVLFFEKTKVVKL